MNTCCMLSGNNQLYAPKICQFSKSNEFNRTGLHITTKLKSACDPSFLEGEQFNTASDPYMRLQTEMSTNIRSSVKSFHRANG